MTDKQLDRLVQTINALTDQLDTLNNRLEELNHVASSK